MAGVLAATLVEPGRLELREYPYPERLEAVTHRFPLTQAALAMETALRADGAMEVVIEPQRDE